MSSPDVIIVGAGPAGLTAADVLRKDGVDFKLYSRESIPGEGKVCGGFVPAVVFKEFGLELSSDCFPIDTIRMRFPGTEPTSVGFEQPVGYGLTREALGLALLNKVDHHKEVVHMNTEVRKVSVDVNSCEVDIAGPNGEETVLCKLLIDCSGANPISLRWGLVRDRPPNSAMGYAIQHIMERKPDTSKYENIADFFYGHEFSPGGYAWLFPRSDAAIVGTGGLVSNIRSSSTKLEQYIQNFINHPVINERLKNSQLARKEAALVPLAGIVGPSYSDRIMLAGDAAAHCSPITGEGIHYSMVGGQCAGEIASKAVANNDFSKKHLSEYEKLWKSKIGSDLKWGAWLQGKLTTKKSIGMSGFVQSEDSVRFIAEMLVGLRSVRNSILIYAEKYLKAKVGL